MKIKKYSSSTFLGVIYAFLLLCCILQGNIAYAKNEVSEQKNFKSEPAAVQKNVESNVAQEIEDQRKTIVSEAVMAVEATQLALDALEKGNKEQALTALENATGKLDLILAREPKLALAPIYVGVVIHDLYATPRVVRNVLVEIEENIHMRNIQHSRRLMSRLGSKVVIHVTNIPLATFPQVIKEIAALIDKERIDEAKARLALALNTLVITHHVVPLPYVRFLAILKNIEILYTDVKTTNGDKKQIINNLLKAARNQLELAEVLGYSYGKKDIFKSLSKQLDQIEKKIKKIEPIGEDLQKEEELLKQISSNPDIK